VNVTPAEYETLTRRHAQARADYPVLEGWTHGALVVFIPGKPYNFKSEGHGTRGALMKHRRLVKAWRERTAAHLLPFAGPGRTWPWPAATPKAVTFTVYSWNAFDSDGREVAASPCRDALKDMQLVTDDRDAAQNVFTYAQIVTRRRGAVYGIAIRITLRSAHE
jgi:hypothetical protein